MPDDISEVVYQIDRDDLLITFNEQWDVFAEDNDSPFLVSRRIYKTPIWNFIRDAETRHLHEVLLKKVRRRDVMLDLAFRCDSAVLRRFMNMCVYMKSDGKVEYRTRILKTEAREAMPVTSPCEPGTGPFLRMCSWCKKIDAGNDAWMEIEEAVNFLGLFSSARIQQISHTMCDACLSALEDG